jgi:signal transduction histidine kinase
VIVRTSVKGGLVNVDIADRGKGIPPGKEEEVFLPFFTTKSDGTGLGLPIAKKIAEAHGGKLEVREGAVKGATFRVSFPV